MNMKKKLKMRKKRRALRVKNSFKSKTLKLRVTVFRSLNHIYAQIIDDSLKKTIVSFSSLGLKNEVDDKTAVARLIGKELGKKAKAVSIENVFFDRGQYRYHGRIRALADGLRDSGLNF